MGYMGLCVVTVNGNKKVINCQTKRKPFTTRLIYYRGSMASVVEFRSKFRLYKGRGPFRVSPVRVKVEEMIIKNLKRLALKCKSAAEAIFFCFVNVHLSMYVMRLFSRGKAGIKQMVNMCEPPLLVESEEVWICVTLRCRIRTKRLGYFWLALFYNCEICDLKGRYIMLSFFFFPETSHAGETARRRGCENSSSCQGDES